MTLDERLKSTTRKLELLSLETEKRDKQLVQLSTLVTEITKGTAELLSVAKRF